jgi:hypothetical protein
MLKPRELPDQFQQRRNLGGRRGRDRKIHTELKIKKRKSKREMKREGNVPI